MSKEDYTDAALYLIGELLDELPEEGQLYHIDLHKILYLLEKEIDDSNSIADMLPFYWYRHGPVSQTVFDARDQAQKTGVANVDENEHEASVISPGPQEPPAPSVPDSDLSDAEATLTEIVEDYNFRESRDKLLEEKIYTEAPYRFQSTFKFDVLPTVRDFVRNDADNTDALMDYLYSAEGKVPLDDEFSEFGRVFSRYVSLAEVFISGYDGEDALLKAEFEELTKICWEMFCNRLRCQTADGEYSNSIESWEDDAEQSLRLFRQSLDEFDQSVENQGYLDDEISRINGGEPWAKMSQTILSEN